MKNYTQIGLKYAQDVVAGKVIACQLTIKACQRHLDDLERVGNEDFPYVFDEIKAANVCIFVENLQHVKGIWANQKIKLEPWQVFILMNVFGWLHRDTGFRRFKNVYIEVPRKNAKSTLTAAVALYMLTEDGEEGAEIYSAATSSNQARIVFDAAQAMARKSPAFCNAYGVTVLANNISVIDKNSKYEAVHAQGKRLDGLNSHFASNDELHAHPDRTVYDVMETSMGSRTQPILWNITTAGTNLIGICSEQHDYTENLVNKVFVDESYFGIIYTIDEGDDWKDPKVWAKANPNLDVSVFIQYMDDKCRKAINSPASLNNFLTKHLNVWCNSDAAWLNIEDWHKCNDPAIAMSLLVGEPCYIGIDLASKVDIAAMVLLFPRPDKKFLVFGKYYIPERRLNPQHNPNSAQYHAWVRDGRMTATPGDIIDYSYIKDDLLEFVKQFNVLEVAYDPFQATQFVVEMGKEGFASMVEVGATVKNFSEPMKRLEALIISKNIQHDGDPVMTWMMSNITAHEDKKENIFPNKKNREAKIDGAVAAIMALNRAQFENTDSKEPAPYAGGGVTFI